MLGLEFLNRFVGWVMKCIRTTCFSIMVNGSLEGYFPRKRDLR